MITKSITHDRPRPRAELNADTGKDDHPLITCAPHLLGGHAHLSSTKTTIERVLRAELQHIEGPLSISSGLVVSEEERHASLRFAIDVLAYMAQLEGRMRPNEPPGRTPGPRIAKTMGAKK